MNPKIGVQNVAGGGGNNWRAIGRWYTILRDPSMRGALRTLRTGLRQEHPCRRRNGSTQCHDFPAQDAAVAAHSRRWIRRVRSAHRLACRPLHRRYKQPPSRPFYRSVPAIPFFAKPRIRELRCLLRCLTPISRSPDFRFKTHIGSQIQSSSAGCAAYSAPRRTVATKG